MIRKIASIAFAIGAIASTTAAYGDAVFINSGLMWPESRGNDTANATITFNAANSTMLLSNGAIGDSAASISHTFGSTPPSVAINWNFTLEHRTGEGFIFRLVSGDHEHELAWGSFTNGPLSSSAAIGGVSPGGSFNAIQVHAAVVGATSSVSFDSWKFVSSTLQTADGMLESRTVTSSTWGPTDVPLYLAPGVHEQWIIGNVDLAQHSWTVSGNVAATSDFADAEDLVEFSVTASNLTTIPEPATIALLGLAAVATRRKRIAG